MSNSVTDLRDELFATMRALRDPNSPMDIERAKAIADVAQVIINSAKVEVEHMRLTGGTGAGFIPDETAQGLPGGTTKVAEKPGVTVTRHTLRG